MLVKENDKEIYNIIERAGFSLIRNPSKAVFGYTLMSIPIAIDVIKLNEIEVKQKPKNEIKESNNWIVATDGRGIMIRGTLEALKNIFLKFPPEELLIHELCHILLKHRERTNSYIELKNEYPKFLVNKVANIAQDYIIDRDEHLSTDLTKRFMLDSFSLTENDLNGSFEEISNKILKKFPTSDELKAAYSKTEKLPDNFSDFEAMGNHIINNNFQEFDEFCQSNSQNFNGNYTKYLEDVEKRALMQYGSGTSGIWKTLEKLFCKPLVNWKFVLSDELKNYKKSEIEDNGYKKINRRYYIFKSQTEKNIPLMFLKYKKTFNNGVIAIDTSGSIDDETYKKEVSETLRLIKHEGMNWTVLLFDDGIRKEINFKTPTENVVKDLLTRTYGGTSITEVLDYCNKTHRKILILISDMYFNYKLPMKNYKGFRKLFISTVKKEENNDEIRTICDKITWFNPYEE